MKKKVLATCGALLLIYLSFLAYILLGFDDSPALRRRYAAIERTSQEFRKRHPNNEPMSVSAMKKEWEEIRSQEEMR